MKQTRPDLYLDTLRNLTGGQTSEDASKALAKCVQRSTETGKKSTITIKLTINPVGTNSSQIEIHDSIITKLPEINRGGSLVFATTDGNLTRTNPRQQAMDLRGVDVPDTTNLKTTG